jgi:antirestriction protein ArdC
VLANAAHEAWFEKLEIARILTRDLACYIPRKDVIGMPPVGAFNTADDYAATLNHESVHATMASHRVGRDMGKKFTQHAIGAEELVAEIGASILGAHLNMPPHHIHDHASYIGHWMMLLGEDKRAFLTAAAQAQTAVDWLLAKSPSPFAAPVDPGVEFQDRAAEAAGAHHTARGKGVSSARHDESSSAARRGL